MGLGRLIAALVLALSAVAAPQMAGAGGGGGGGWASPAPAPVVPDAGGGRSSGYPRWPLPTPRALHSGRPRRVPLPTYPFQRRRFWVDGMAGMITPPAPTMAGRIDDLDRWTYVPTWRNQPGPVADHSEAARAAGPWLVLAADPRGEAIAEHLRATGADVTKLFRSDRKDEAAKIIPDELVDDSAIVGDLAYVQEQIKAWEAAGVTMMVVGARSTEQIRDLAALV